MASGGQVIEMVLKAFDAKSDQQCCNNSSWVPKASAWVSGGS